eukprot:TRINITY_DN52430_c0_g1_i1.p1 TRINITY_DN52430_c0_g1~~TRINITY_DN52430_c0_g1_i1.p1  ORF type:complete len:377 (+),score=65.34 TRINITY_DN52430_c0_g1_i1:54-1133(+)
MAVVSPAMPCLKKDLASRAHDPANLDPLSGANRSTRRNIQPRLRSHVRRDADVGYSSWHLGAGIGIFVGAAASSTSRSGRHQHHHSSQKRVVSLRARATYSLASIAELKDQLLQELCNGEEAIDQVSKKSAAASSVSNSSRPQVEAAQRVEDIVEELTKRQQQQPVDVNEAKLLMEGRWKLLSTFVPGQAAADITSLQSWSEYIFKKGPSPVQAAFFTNEAAQKVYQIIDLKRSTGRWYNIVDGSPLGLVCLEADISVERPEASSSTGNDGTGSSLRFQWTGGFIVVCRFPWSSENLENEIRFPYPVPFSLLGDRAIGSFDTVYLDEDLRIARGSKSNSIFILAREHDKVPLEEEFYKA